MQGVFVEAKLRLRKFALMRRQRQHARRVRSQHIRWFGLGFTLDQRFAAVTNGAAGLENADFATEFAAFSIAKRVSAPELAAFATAIVRISTEKPGIAIADGAISIEFAGDAVAICGFATEFVAISIEFAPFAIESGLSQ